MTLVVDVSCRGSSQTRRLLLNDGDQLEIGRANEKLGFSHDRRLSRKHFLLKFSNRQIEIAHLSKTNPTLVATEGAEKFEPIEGKFVESQSCRIIAGSHRFVAVVEPIDSVAEPTPSAEVTAEIWSDVDDDLAKETPTPQLAASPPSSANPRGLASPVPGEETRAVGQEQPANAGFSFDSGITNLSEMRRQSFSGPESGGVEANAAEGEQGTSPSPPVLPDSKSQADSDSPQQTSTNNRNLFFPLDDDFFD